MNGHAREVVAKLRGQPERAFSLLELMTVLAIAFAMIAVILAASLIHTRAEVRRLEGLLDTAYGGQQVLIKNMQDNNAAEFPPSDPNPGSNEIAQ